MISPNQVVPICESTNDLARALGEAGHPSFTWIQAMSQTGGRGRTQNQWVSDPGNLYLSLILRDIELKDWTWIPLIAALVVSVSIEQLIGKNNIIIKWPNDLWCDQKKLAGILCESVCDLTQGFIVVGIGVNCEVGPTGIGISTVAINQLSSQKITANKLRIQILSEFKNSIEILKRQDFEKIKKLFFQESMFKIGDKISWLDIKKNLLEGRVLGLGDFGELLVLLPDGETKRLVAEEISNLRL